MLYAIAAIVVSLVVLALIGKPLRIEVIHTTTPQPIPKQLPVLSETSLTKSKDEPPEDTATRTVMDIVQSVNELFHNVEVGDTNAKR